EITGVGGGRRLREAALSGPLNTTHTEADALSRDLPALIRTFNDGANRTGGDDPPAAIIDLRNVLRGAVHPGAQRADAKSVGDKIDVASIRRIVVIDITRRCVALQLQTGTRFPIEINCIPLIEIQTK